MSTSPAVNSSFFNRLLDYVRETDGAIGIQCRKGMWAIAVKIEGRVSSHTDRNFAIACRKVYEKAVLPPEEKR